MTLVYLRNDFVYNASVTASKLLKYLVFLNAVHVYNSVAMGHLYIVLYFLSK